MRIHRLNVTHFRGIDTQEVVFPDQGVLVLQGANEVGKSSLVDALDMLIDHKDDTTRRHVKAVRPIGRDVATTVAADITAGPYRFSYRKRWFKQPATELDITSPRTEHLTGVEAHERVREILTENTDMALWGALRLLQATALDQVALADSTALAAALDTAAGTTAAAAGGDGDTIMAAAEEELRRYYTPGRKETGELRDALASLAQAEEAAAQADREVREVEDDVRRHEALSTELNVARTRWGTAQEQLREITAQWSLVEDVQGRRAAAATHAEAAAREAAYAQDRRRERHDLIAEEERHTGDLERAVALAEERRVALHPLERRRDDLETAHQDAQAQVERLARDVESVENAEERARAERLVESAQTRRQAVTAADQRRQEAAAAVAELPEVDDRIVRSLEKAATAVEVAQARSDAQSAQVVLEGLGDAEDILVDGQPLQLHAGEHQAYPVDAPFDVEIPGRVRLRLRPAAGHRERSDDVSAARSELAGMLRQFGVDDVEAARHLADRRRDAQAVLAHAEDRLVGLLGEDTPQDVEDAVTAARAAVDRLRPAAHQPTLVLDRDLTQLRADLRAARDQAAELAAALAGADRAVTAAREEQAVAAAQVEGLRGVLLSVRERLSRHRAQLADDQVDLVAAQATVQADSAVAALQEVDGQLAELDATGLGQRRESAMQAERASAERVDRLREDQIGVSARLEQSGRQGRYDAQATAQADLEHAQDRAAAVRRRAAAARMLCDTLEARRTQARAAYIEPFSAALRRFGTVVYGADMDVEVDDRLAVTARFLGGRRVPYESLSTGAREQLAILTRLAAATLVDPEHGVPVVIDDALGWSDPERQRRMVAAFGMLSERVQVVLLTCEPGRYDGVPGAHHRTWDELHAALRS
ncbi:hypothetical protein KEM60_01749 [Austwickia sp. TVS 96-490-7B]|uniref:AAA family ATPase n=1 Tax=Austwickia sp. TVS 96-490-7B TaxID=2830843 RepID=UPI001C5779A9|nr:AAA family ATPase [Austwickia sp. TVS 96-490-7B]MBW3085549.1 hypothetical protein [Austwickia sp. TVS 96-490-7B]